MLLKIGWTFLTICKFASNLTMIVDLLIWNQIVFPFFSFLFFCIFFCRNNEEIERYTYFSCGTVVTPIYGNRSSYCGYSTVLCESSFPKQSKKSNLYLALFNKTTITTGSHVSTCYVIPIYNLQITQMVLVLPICYKHYKRSERTMLIYIYYYYKLLLNILVKSWWSVLMAGKPEQPEKTTDWAQVTDNLFIYTFCTYVSFWTHFATDKNVCH